MARMLEARMKAINKAMNDRARALNLCPKHMTRLWCVQEIVWAGTEAELYDGLNLYLRLQPYLPKTLPSTHQMCAKCGEPLVCEPCDEANLHDMPPMWVPDEVMTPEEMARWGELKGRFLRTPGEHTDAFDALIQKLAPSWPEPPRASEPISVPEPLPPPSPTPQLTPTRQPEPVVAPPSDIQGNNITVNSQVVDDEDDEVDTELSELVAELQRRLAP